MNKTRHVVMLGTGFDTRGGISSVVNVYRENGLFQRFPVLYIRTHTDGSIARRLLVCAQAWIRFAVLLLLGRVALVHVHMSTDGSFWRKLLFLCPALICKVPSILHLHGADFDEFYGNGSGVRKWIMRKTFDAVDCIVVLSRIWQTWAQSISRNPLIVPIYNPVLVPPPLDFHRRDTTSILFLGRLGNRKGAYDLLEAIARIVDRHPGLKLVMAGDGDAAEVRAAVARLGLQKHVDVLDWVSGQEKTALLERAAIYALPSYSEGFPMSVLEAMAAGIPVVCTPVGGVPEAITDGREGCLIEPGDITALSEALDTLLSSLEMRAYMGAAARQKIESAFSPVHVLPQVERLYRQLGAQQCRP